MINRKTVSLADQVFETIEKNILSGVYKKGEVLTEMKLSEELGVSRTPIREALSALQQEHMLESKGKGMVVLGITAYDMQQIFEIRKRIEGLAARECAINIRQEEIRELEDTVELQEFYLNKNDSEKMQNYDGDFHALIYKYSGSPVYYDTLLPLHKKVQKYRQSSLEYQDRGEASIEEHRKILEAIKAHDAIKAQEEMERHVRNAEKNILQMMEEA